MDGFHSYAPADGHRLAHDPLNSIVAPRPIGWISTLSADGVANLAPYSFFNLFNYRPPILGFASTGWKDSVRNIQDTGEFVWNLVSEDLGPAMNATCASVPPDVDEFALAGLDAAASQRVKPPRVAATKVAFECRLSQFIRLQTADGADIDTWLVLGEVVMIHIAHDLIVGGVYDTLKSRPLLRGGGPADYFTIDESKRLRMTRPA
ncbi:flavin reductase family protein [Magnetospirillum sp. 64-120]|uniref:flavin reductase family protein n=1 Tax=Magnetospirillum sp. 64-120 TaxID=1895778 RepID=UPI00092ACAE5|nr:flavin reductase family protein [Magnetospirillum sp. 64-120]OJX77466.1 MAG: Asp/Glu/hydantoin racemase [Magnetospirillum sp. 64-120]